MYLIIRMVLVYLVKRFVRSFHSSNYTKSINLLDTPQINVVNRTIMYVK